uniref:LRAT domain-containing protein n=1 Tax=Sparus aurata TaxID=8175 RepID=A0A671WWV6_SPAAU
MFLCLFSSKSDQTPKPGDLIEVLRGGYQHWAVYVGDGYVVHLTTPPDAFSSLRSVPTEKAMVRREKLEEAVGDNTWRINNSLDKKYEPRSASIIVKGQHDGVLRPEQELILYLPLQVRKAVMVAGGAAVVGIGVLAGALSGGSKTENKNTQ